MAKKKAGRKNGKSNRTAQVVVIVLFLVLCGWLVYSYMQESEKSQQTVAADDTKVEKSTDKSATGSDNKSGGQTSAKSGKADGSDPLRDAKWETSRSAEDIAFDTDGLEMPHFECADFVITNADGRYTIMYDTLYRQAAWVCYLLTRDDVAVKGAERQNKFVPDPEVVRRGYPTARTSHYTNTGYDRGHLLPSADRAGNQTENDATFCLSNISPQTPTLNRRIWKNLEEQVRTWAERYDSVYVVTGGVLKPGLQTIKNGIGIPEHFFKVLLTRHDDCWQTIAFILPNEEKIEGRFMDYAVTVDSAEVFTQQDFFHRLPDHIEDVIEAACDMSFWAL